MTAIAAALADPATRTPDLGGTATTGGVVDAIVTGLA